MSFASLPFELRSLIWSLAVAPRHITINKVRAKGSFSNKHRQQGKDILYETSSTPPPALMHVCSESRQQAPYKRAFTAGTEPRWTWVNFELDIFCVSSLYAVSDMLSHRSEIQRLQIRTDDDIAIDWYEAATRYNGLSGVYQLENLGEIQVVLEPGDLMWGDVFKDWGLGRCPQDNITFLDEGSGLVLTGDQLKMVGDWRVVFSFDSEGNPPDPDRLSEEIAHVLDDSWHMTWAQIHELD
ncbi:uncharacterized protein TrAtP1_002542 [Trichoderma atroviride]|nr:hypothetical protein TrAtP1_002542 [Trichoderma atroviride]